MLRPFLPQPNQSSAKCTAYTYVCELLNLSQLHNTAPKPKLAPTISPSPPLRTPPVGIGGNNTKPKRIHLTPLPPERVLHCFPVFEAIPSPIPFTSSARGGFSVNPPYALPLLFTSYTCPSAAIIPRHLPYQTKPSPKHLTPIPKGAPVSTQPQKST